MQHVNVVDCPSLHYAADVLAEREGVQRLTFDYQALKEHLVELRTRERWPRATLDLALSPLIFNPNLKDALSMH